MKKYITLLAFLFVVTFTFAQDFEAPDRGAKIYSSTYNLALDENGEGTFELWIVRSKFAKKSKFMAPIVMNSNGLQFEVTQNTNNKDHYMVKVTAEGVEPGQYSATVSARSTGTQKVTGTTLSFNVDKANSIASKEGQ